MKTILILFPSVLAMYVLYFLDTHQIWDASTPFRDAATIAIMATALAASFIVFSKIYKK